MPKKPIQQYDVVQAKTPEELVRLVNLKTKFGWKCLGGMVYTPGNQENCLPNAFYPYCQSVMRIIKK